MARQGSLRRNTLSNQQCAFTHRCGWWLAALMAIAAILGVPMQGAALADEGSSSSRESTVGNASQPAEIPDPSDANIEKQTLDFRFPDDKPIVTAGQKMAWQWQINGLSGHASQNLILRYSIHSAKHGHQVLSGRRQVKLDESGNSPSIEIDDPAPSVPGVYEFRCNVSAPSDYLESLWDRLRSKDHHLASAVQPLLVSSVSPAAARDLKQRSSYSASWQTLATIRPSDSSWSVRQWLPQSAAKLIPGSNLLPGLRTIDGEVRKGKHSGESTSVLGPKQVFHASLPTMAMGYPHRVTVRCPKSNVSKLRIDLGSGPSQQNAVISSLIETSDNSVLGLDAGANQPNNEWIESTYLYYPNGDDQFWLTNVSDVHDAAFASIEVTAGPEKIESAYVDNDHQPLPGRLFIVSVDDPDWTSLVSLENSESLVKRGFDSRTAELHRAWVASGRLVDRVHAIYANGLLVHRTPPTDNQPSLRQAVSIEDVLFDRLNSSYVLGFLDFEIESAFRTVGRQDAQQLDSSKFSGLVAVCDQLDRYESFAGVVLRTNNATMTRPSGETVSTVSDVETNKALSESLQRLFRSRTVMFLEPNNASFKQAFSSLVRSVFSGAISVKEIDCGSTEKISAGPAQSDVGPVQDSKAVFARNQEGNGHGNVLVGLRCNQISRITQAVNELDASVLIVDSKLCVDQIDSELQNTAKIHLVHRSSSIDVQQNAKSDRLITVRHLRNFNRQWITVGNQMPWAVYVNLSVSNESSSSGLHSITPEHWRRTLPIVNQFGEDYRNGEGWVIPPNATVVLDRATLQNADPARLDWNISIVGGDSARKMIESKVTEVVERLGMSSQPERYDQLINGGFETTGDLGLVGWLHAQHPKECVVVDRDDAFEGLHSVRMTTENGTTSRTWMVSDTFRSPATKRLSVSMACRAKSRITSPESADPAKVRVSIEGNQLGGLIRRSVEISIPTDEQWHQKWLLLEALDLGQNGKEGLRLTIDSLTAGEIWIDDVRLHNQFASRSERDELQNLAFLAVEGLQRGNLKPAARLLNNHWSNRLFGMNKKTKSDKKQVAENAAKEVEVSKPPAAKVSDQRGSWLFERLRF